MTQLVGAPDKSLTPYQSKFLFYNPMNSALRTYLLLLVLASIGIALFRFAPPSRNSVTLSPSTKYSAQMESFSDSGVTGSSQIQIVKKNNPIQANMVLIAPADQPSWAGFGWLLNDANWSFMDTLYLEVRGQGFSELELKILTFDPDHTKPENRSSYRQVIKEVAISSQMQKIAIPTEQFYIPDWWYSQEGVSKDLDSKHLEKVYRIDIQPSSKTPRNVPLLLEIQSVTITGTSSRNLAILLGYLFLLMIIALGTNPHKRKAE